MKRQTRTEQAAGTGTGCHIHPDPGSLPTRFSHPIGDTGQTVQVYLDKDHAIVKRNVGGLPLTLVVPIHVFEGIMVRVVPGESTGSVRGSLTLKHPDDALSITLADTDRPENLSATWTAWSKRLNLPMLVCDTGGAVKPIEAYRAQSHAAPAPRRKLGMLTGRRPRFLVRRRVGTHADTSRVHRGEREIIART